MDADKQDWFLKQQELVFDAARKLPGITFVEPIQTRETKSSSASFSSTDFSSTASTTVDDIEDDFKDDESLMTWKSEPIQSILQQYDAPPPPPDSELPPTPDVESSEPVRAAESGGLMGMIRKALLRSGAQEAEVEQLQRYVARLRAMIGVKETRILQLHKKMKNVKKKAKDEVDKYSKWAADQLANIARTYRENQILWLNTQLEIEVYHVRSWTKLADQIDLYLSKREKETLALIMKQIYKQEDDKLTLIEPTDFELPHKYKILKTSIIQMEAVLSQLRQAFRDHRKAEHAKATKMQDRSQKIRFLLRKGAIDSLKDSFEGTYFHHVDRVSQNEFNRLMIDQRHIEGVTLEQWNAFLIQNLNADTESGNVLKGIFRFMKTIVVENELPPNDNLLKADPMSFAEDDAASVAPSTSSISSEISKSVSVSDSHGSGNESDESRILALALESGTVVTVWSVLKVYVDRLIYPRLSHIFSHFTDPEDTKRDQEFTRKCRWLCKLSQDDFKIHKQLCYKPPMDTNGNLLSAAGPKSQPTVAYSRAIKHLSRMEVECENVPINVLGHCVKFGKLIEEDAKLYITDKKFVYSADDLVPVVEWCIAHAKLLHPHELVAHTHRFLGNDASTGQGGYYLSSIEVALSALMAHNPVDFGMSDAAAESLGLLPEVGRLSISVSRDENKTTS
eukprot:TRINITY_DN4349_c0_g1_i1.p1 TRINITY_DN4349_c0_g1~~TRINITY_DN4349_c0_g1_i1.p1  ORF type:complete len:789 (-),score=175.24 TRINITY_DN4349_c0_g1_i1:3005-5041(-)